MKILGILAQPTEMTTKRREEHIHISKWTLETNENLAIWSHLYYYYSNLPTPKIDEKNTEKTAKRLNKSVYN